MMQITKILIILDQITPVWPLFNSRTHCAAWKAGLNLCTRLGWDSTGLGVGPAPPRKSSMHFPTRMDNYLWKDILLKNLLVCWFYEILPKLNAGQLLWQAEMQNSGEWHSWAMGHIWKAILPMLPLGGIWGHQVNLKSLGIGQIPGGVSKPLAFPTGLLKIKRQLFRTARKLFVQHRTES